MRLSVVISLITVVSSAFLTGCASEAGGEVIPPAILISAGPATDEPSRPTATFDPTAQVISMADNGRELELQVGDRLRIDRGEGLIWLLSSSHPDVLSEEGGVYLAHSPGTTELSGTINPSCYKANPPCLAPSTFFSLTITVHWRSP